MFPDLLRLKLGRLLIDVGLAVSCIYSLSYVSRPLALEVRSATDRRRTGSKLYLLFVICFPTSCA